jgi:hypothetical protein
MTTALPTPTWTSTICASSVGRPGGSRTLPPKIVTKIVADTLWWLGRNPSSMTWTLRRLSSTLARSPKSSLLASHHRIREAWLVFLKKYEHVVQNILNINLKTYIYQTVYSCSRPCTCNFLPCWPYSCISYFLSKIQSYPPVFIKNM